jgi:hypothetical protein
MTRYFYILLTLVLFQACSKKEGSLFKNPSPKETGIDFVNRIDKNDKLNILDYLYFYNGGGVAIGDLNNDGLPEIFFSGNQVKNRLYLNKGGLKFEDISESAGISGNSSWNSGAVMGDVNGDGLLDIYVCSVVGLNGFSGFNELYINNGDLTFTESAADYRLDHESFSSTAAFLDYDLDGDLDIYLLNHAVHTQESFGKAELRNRRNYETGDKLLRNDGGSFTDVSEEAGIFGGVNGYGLSVAVSDFNQDGNPDIYVCNDFHEDDYYYLNNGDGTFSERLKDYFGHTTRFSMGSDVADINHDGWPDIISLDMLPEDEAVLKASDGDEALQILKMRVEQFGYHYQFTRNTLQVNQPGYKFVETALLSGIAATDWSWSGLFEDFDQDGHQDLFISNGIPKRPNNLDFIKFVSSEEIKKKINNTRLVDQEALDMMPHGKVHNYIYQGDGSVGFTDRSGDWIENDSLISGATALGDLDNDGDLDLVVSNINEPAALYINKTDEKANYLKIKFELPNENRFGLGTKVFSYVGDQIQYKELYTVRGLQSSSEPLIHFGYGDATVIDSIRIIWPDRTTQMISQVPTNQLLTLSPEGNEKLDPSFFEPPRDPIFRKIPDNLGVDFKHVENNYNDFNVIKLIPYQVTDRGPALAIGDLNGDDKEDIFFGGSRKIPSQVYLQKEDGFEAYDFDAISRDSVYEDVAALIDDLNGDGRNDLFVGTGGADFYQNPYTLLDNYYQGTSEGFEKSTLPDYFENASVIAPNDIDGDGDLDLFVAAHAVSNDFGKIPGCYLLTNTGDSFELQENNELVKLGMVTDATWMDFDSDGTDDLVVVGEWMQPRFFRNNNGSLEETTVTSGKLKGLWRTLIPFDIDKDGDKDLLLGNWGSNTKFRASADHPMKMHHLDFDNNGKSETVISIEKNGNYYPLANLDELAGQMNTLRKKFRDYASFAGRKMEEIFDKKLLDSADLFEVHELRSGYLKNDNGTFEFRPFGWQLQVSPINSFVSFDFDADQEQEVLAAGNYFGVKPFHGRFDGFAGALIHEEGSIQKGHEIGLDLSGKSARHLKVIFIQDKPHLLVVYNNEEAEVYELGRFQNLKPDKPKTNEY